MEHWKLVVGVEASYHTYEILSQGVALGAFEDALELFQSWGFHLRTDLSSDPFRRYLLHPEDGVYALVALERVFPENPSED